MQIDVSVTKVFSRLYRAWQSEPRYISSCGGTRSGKTYSALQLLMAIAMQEQSLIISVVSETLPHLKRGAIRDFKQIMSTAGLWSDKCWNKTESIYNFDSGSIVEFFSVDSPAKVHGPARDILFVNECQNIDYDIIRQLLVRTKKRALFDYNPTHSFWINEKIELLPDCKTIHSVYTDNSFLTSEQVREIESNRQDENWWRVYGEGKVGVLEGIIYGFEQIDSLPESGDFREAYGMDFGFTNDPTALIHILINTGKKEIYLDELIYQSGMLNSEIAQAMESGGVPKRGVPIYCDSAEPKTIEELCRAGFNAKPADKRIKKAEQIQMLKGYKQFITKRSTNLIKEHRGYVWQKDKDGKTINEPIAFNDHAEDAWRYGAFGLLSYGGGIRLGFGRNYVSSL